MKRRSSSLGLLSLAAALFAASCATVSVPRWAANCPPALSGSAVPGAVYVPCAGPPEEILSSWSKNDGWPDGTMGVLNHAGTYTFIAANGDNHSTPDGRPRILVGTLDHPKQKSNRSVAIGAMKERFDYVGGGPTYDVGNGTWVMIYHAERSGAGETFHSFLGMAKSTNSGASWSDLGLIITTQTPYNASRNNSLEMGMGGFKVINDAGADYMYVYFQDFLGNAAQRNLNALAVARARVADIAAAAANGTAPVFRKHCSGSVSVGRFSSTCAGDGSPWGENGLGGISDLRSPDNKEVIYPTVTFNTFTNTYVMVGSTPQEDHPWPATDGVLMQSADGITWTDWRRFVQEPGTVFFYPTQIGTGDDPATTGQTFYVYYVYSTTISSIGIATGPLERRLVTMVKAGN